MRFMRQFIDLDYAELQKKIFAGIKTQIYTKGLFTNRKLRCFKLGINGQIKL